MIKLDEAISREYEIVDNCVSRSGVITLIMNLNLKHLFSFPSGISKKAFEDLLNGAQALPPATPIRKKGKWIKHEDHHSVYYDCSLCGCLAPCTETDDSFIWKLSNYCPDCGARMENK